MYTRKIFTVLMIKHAIIITSLLCGIIGLLVYLQNFEATMTLYVASSFLGFAGLIHLASYQVPYYQLCRFKRRIIKAGGQTSKHIKRGQYHTYEYVPEIVEEAALKKRAAIIEDCHRKYNAAKARLYENELLKHDLVAKDIIETYYNVAFRF